MHVENPWCDLRTSFYGVEVWFVEVRLEDRVQGPGETVLVYYISGECQVGIRQIQCFTFVCRTLESGAEVFDGGDYLRLQF